MPQPQMPAMTNWRFEVDFERIGWLTIDTPKSPVNTLSRLALQELETALLRVEDLIASGEVIGRRAPVGQGQRVHRRRRCQRVRRDGRPLVLPEALKRAHAVMDRIESMKVPVDRGDPRLLRWAAGWSWRSRATTGSPSTTTRRALGFPEVNLGIFPGFGGTGRSIRQAGRSPAMQAMLTGRMIKAGAARGMGLVDKLVRHRDMLHWEARQGRAAASGSRRRRRWRSASWRGPLRCAIVEQDARRDEQEARARALSGAACADRSVREARRRSGGDDRGRERRASCR